MMIEENRMQFANYSYGEQAYEAVSEICEKYGTRVLVIGGKTGMEKGMPLLQESLGAKKSNLEIVEQAVYGRDCTRSAAKTLADRFGNSKIDMIFGMGGGKAMDTAKETARMLALPVFTFPTIPSNCAAMTALSVLYHEDGSFDCFSFFERPAVHCFIHTGILKESPYQYFRAGIGDTIGKYFECHFSARGDELDYHSALGREISNLCYERILTYAKRAAKEKEAHTAGDAFNQVVLTIIVNTGLVSRLVQDCYNCAVAHSVCYGLDLLPEVTKKYLHGDLVAYGVLVQLIVDGQKEKALEVKNLIHELGMPVSLSEMGVTPEKKNLQAVIEETVSGPDMEHIPYKVTEEMIWKAMEYLG